MVDSSKQIKGLPLSFKAIEEILQGSKPLQIEKKGWNSEHGARGLGCAAWTPPGKSV